MKLVCFTLFQPCFNALETSQLIEVIKVRVLTSRLFHVSRKKVRFCVGLWPIGTRLWPKTVTFVLQFIHKLRCARLQTVLLTAHNSLQRSAGHSRCARYNDHYITRVKSLFSRILRYRREYYAGFADLACIARTRVRIVLDDRTTDFSNT